MLTAALLLSAPLDAIGQEPFEDSTWRRPLANRNQFPPALLFLVLEPERATVHPRGEAFFAVDFAYSNIVSISYAPTETLVVDLESIRFLLGGQVGLGKGFEVGATLPVYYFYGGVLDGVISGFHEAFGLPNAIRRREPEGAFRYRYQVSGAPVLERTTSVFASGDATVSMKKAVPLSGATELALRAAVKFPTGSRELVSGSGTTDFGFGVAASRVGRRVGGYLNVSYQILGDPAPLALESRNYLSVSAGADVRLKTNLVFAFELDHLGRFLKSNLPVLDRDALQLVFGFRYRRSERFIYEWRFTEDLSRTSPDFTFGFRLEFVRRGGGARSLRLK